MGDGKQKQHVWLALGDVFLYYSVGYGQAASVGLVGVATISTHAGQLLRVYRVEQRGFADFAERPIVSRSSLVIVNAGDMLYICL